MQPRCGVHGASLRARPKGRAVSRCCPRAPRCSVAARDARSAFPKARSASAAAQRAGASTWGLLRFFAGCPPRTARRLRCGRVTGAPAPCPACAGANPAARRTGRSSPPAIPRLYKPPQGLRARSGPRPPQARYARPCRALPPWCGAAAAGFPQPRPGSGRRAPSRAPSSPGFARAPCLFGAAARPAAPGLPCGLRRPEKAAAGSCSRSSPHPPPAPQGAGAQDVPTACFSLSVVI